VLLTELLTADRIQVPLGSSTKDDLLRELVELATRGKPPATVEAILRSVHERERELSTGIGEGIAIPHGRTSVIDQIIMSAGVAPRPVDYDALDGKPVDLFFLLVGPESASGAHVKALARISRLLRRESLREQLRSAASSDAFLRIVRDAEAA
jgi:mannitol/fructose-specific phosphotransferase system IIA component (Ntr-type)